MRKINQYLRMSSQPGLRIRTGLRAGSTDPCADDVYKCCNNSKPCKKCVGECVTANSGWDPQQGAEYACAKNHKCYDKK